MTTTKQQPAMRYYRDLPAKPIMVYPSSPEQREEFEVAAAAEGRKLSPFILWAVQQYIASIPTVRIEAARQRLASTAHARMPIKRAASERAGKMAAWTRKHGKNDVKNPFSKGNTGAE